MKKILIPIMLLAFSAVSLSANSENGKKITDFSDMQKSYYELGKNDAKKIYFYKGYKQAVKDFSILLKKYKNKIKALEAGKYLVEEGKITYPQVYKMKMDDGTYKIVIERPEISKDFSSNELFLIPLYKNTQNDSALQQNKTTKGTSNTETVETSDTNNNFSFFGDSTERGDSSSPLKLSSFNKKEISITINGKNDEVRRILDSNGVKYAETPSGYKIYFNSALQKQNFCKNLTGNENCSQ